MQPPTSGADAAPALKVTGYRARDLSIDLGRAITTRDGTELPLPRLSFDLLVALVRAAPNVVTTDELMRQVWPKVVVNLETVAQRVKLLRSALGDDPQEPRYITGVRGRGYRLACAAEPLHESAAIADNTATAPRRPVVIAVALLVLVALAVALGSLMWGRWFNSPATSSANGQPAAPRSIAVLPFKDLNGDSDDDVLALGIPDALLHQLASFDNLDVIARTSSFSFLGHDEDVRNIGRKLGARYVLEGSVQRDHQRLRVTAQLVDAQSGGRVWSMQFDKTPQNVFELQDAIALEVARALRISLQPGVVPGQQKSTSFEAYLEYLQGTRLLESFRVADFKTAAGHAARAIALDPNYTDAMVLLASANVGTAEFGTGPDHERQFREVLTDALALLDRVLTLNAKDDRAYAERGYVHAFTDSSAAESDFRKALEINPSNTQALGELAAVVYENPARSSEALELIDRALKLDPLEPRLDVEKATFLLYGRGDIGGAEKQLQNALRIDPLFELALSRLAEVYWQDGRFAKAIAVAEQVVAADPLAAQPRQMLMELYLEIGDLKSAEQLAQTLSPSDPVLMETMLLAHHQWLAAGVQAYRAISLGQITPMSEPPTIAALRMHARATGQYGRAIEVLAQRAQTEWDAADRPIVRDPSTLYLNAAGLGDLLMLTDQAARGRRLLEATLAATDHDETAYGKGTLWLDQMRSVVLALLGRNDEAIAVLHRALVERHQLSWWSSLADEPAYAGLRKDSRFQAILTTLREHAGQERQSVAQLRANGIVPDRSRGAPGPLH